MMSWMKEASDFYKDYQNEGGKLKWSAFLRRLGEYTSRFPDRPKIPKKTYYTHYDVYNLLKREARRIAIKEAVDFYKKHPKDFYDYYKAEGGKLGWRAFLKELSTLKN